MARDREFQYITEDIERYKHDRQRKNTISLREQDRRAKREDLKRKQLQRVNERRAAEGRELLTSSEDIPRDEPTPDARLIESQHILADLVFLSGIKAPALTKTDRPTTESNGQKKSETAKRKGKASENN